MQIYVIYEENEEGDYTSLKAYSNEEDAKEYVDNNSNSIYEEIDLY